MATVRATLEPCSSTDNKSLRTQHCGDNRMWQTNREDAVAVQCLDWAARLHLGVTGVFGIVYASKIPFDTFLY